jgi:hypothetical protein
MAALVWRGISGFPLVEGPEHEPPGVR